MSLLSLLPLTCIKLRVAVATTLVQLLPLLLPLLPLLLLLLLSLLLLLLLQGYSVCPSSTSSTSRHTNFRVLRHLDN